jgi:hypothetical protein
VHDEAGFILKSPAAGVEGRLIVAGETMHLRPSSPFRQGE